ncbi:hypothetical protein LSCM4_04609 [Leishmania orientalis]|uniref:Uncharacterized protein n=1 Tax=Leishmania orientalis TaxID=2249476 RepID=A0A836GAJ0_9TRYP|nr:hypothetical protein LSCM4_04609 [Leishmania orientalis]
MWDPRSYISQAVGFKNNSIRSAMLPSLYEYTTRFLFLEEEEKQLRSKICSERIKWESLSFSFCDKVYSASYSVDSGAKEFIDNVLHVVKTVEEDVKRYDATYAYFLERVGSLQKVSSGDEVLCTFANCAPLDLVHAREAYLCFELRSRLPVPPSVSALLFERDSFHFLMKGMACTIPIAAMINSQGAPVRYESCVLESEILSYTNGVCRSLKSVKDWCFITVVAASEIGCTAALLAAETACDDEHVESVLRTLGARGMITCYSCVYSDGSVCQYKQCSNTEDTCASRSSRKYDLALHRARVVRGSRNADAMHLLNDEREKAVPCEVTAFDVALNKATLVATMRTVSDPFYFEVVRRASPIGDMNGTLLVSVKHDSPLHNNILRQGDKMVLLSFADQDVWKNGRCRQWLLGSECDTLETEAGRFPVPQCSLVIGAFLFSTERSFSVGDSVVVIGTAVEVYRHQQLLRASSALFSSLFFHTPFVCKFLHRLHGPIGFVAYSFSFCSSSPLIATALLPLSLTDLISMETDVDPAVVLYFFRSGEDIFAESTYPNFTDALPFPLHHLTGEKANAVAGTVTCRLLEVGSVASHSSCYIVLCVTHVAFDRSEILQFREAGHSQLSPRV